MPLWPTSSRSWQHVAQLGPSKLKHCVKEYRAVSTKLSRTRPRASTASSALGAATLSWSLASTAVVGTNHTGLLLPLCVALLAMESFSKVALRTATKPSWECTHHVKVKVATPTA